MKPSLFHGVGRGEPEIEAAAIGFDEIPEGLRRLEEGGVAGRLLADPG